MRASRWAVSVVVSFGGVLACSGSPSDDPVASGAPAAPAEKLSTSGGTGLAEMTSGQVGTYVIDPDAPVNKAGIFSTFRRTSNGTTDMQPRSTNICVLSDIQGDFGDSCPNSTCDLAPITAITLSGNNWGLHRSIQTRNVGAICYAHSNFTAPAGSVIMWTEQPFFSWVDSGWPECTLSHTGNSWKGDAITFIAGVFGEFEGSGERVWVTQSPTFASGPSTVGARTGVCFGHVEGDVGTYFVGIPQRTAPVFIGAGDARLTAVPTTSEFSVSSNQTVAMARTDRAMCYLTRFSGDFNGNGERLRIFPQVVNGVERWHLQSTAGSGSSAQGKARCLAFDQTPMIVPGPD